MKFIVTLLIALSFFAAADAAKVDIYRSAVQNKTFTLKYRITEFPVRITNREAYVNANWFGPRIVERGHFSDDSFNTGGIIVFDKENSYIEYFHDAYKATTATKDSHQNKIQRRTSIGEGGICTLTKNGETYTFFWEMDDGVKKHYSSKEIFGITDTNLRAFSEEERQKELYKRFTSLNPYDVMYDEYNFGNGDIAEALSAILPADRIIATPNTPVYKFAGSGTLDGGLSYEDFSGEKNGTFYALRYYFSGDQMVKISMFRYTKSGGTFTNFEKHSVDIEEFSTAPDKNYLQLPAGLKDTTKRSKDGDKK